MAVHVFVSLIFLAAGFAQGITGFGSALVAMPLLLLFLDARTAVPLCMLNGLIITLFLSLQLKRHMDWRKVLPLCLGCLPGIYVGVAFLQHADDRLIKGLLGLMLVAYSGFMSLARPRPRQLHPSWALLAGFGTGVIGSAFSAGGPPTIVYTTLTGWDKDSAKATLSGFFFLTGALIALAHAGIGLTTRLVLGHVACSALFVFAGVWAGSRLYARLSKAAYFRAVLLLLGLLGLTMLTAAML